MQIGLRARSKCTRHQDNLWPLPATDIRAIPRLSHSVGPAPDKNFTVRPIYFIFQVPAFAPFFHKRWVLRTAGNGHGHVTSYAYITADAFADIIDVAPSLILLAGTGRQ